MSGRTWTRSNKSHDNDGCWGLDPAKAKAQQEDPGRNEHPPCKGEARSDDSHSTTIAPPQPGDRDTALALALVLWPLLGLHLNFDPG